MPFSPSLRRLRGAWLLAVLACAGCDAGSDADAPPSGRGADDRAAETPLDTSALPLALPTGNIHLLTGDLAQFYMEVDRDTIAGLRRAGWEGGQYGFVRGPAGTGRKKRFVQLHEGVDIRPLYRDDAGEPLDTVRAAMPGRVAYVYDATGSAYGRYVVLAHDWGGSPVYTLYAHLASVGVREGEVVGRRAPLGRLGYTGRGIWRERAHVHFEVALMLSEHASRWFETYHGGQPDLHGRFFGTNLSGVDVPALFAALRANPALSFADFVTGQKPGYRVQLPAAQPPDLLARYPWLWAGSGPPQTTTGAWEVTFTAEGVPIRVAASPRAVEKPEVVWTDPAVAFKGCQTNRILSFASDKCVPSSQGLRYLALLATTAEGAPSW